MFGVKTVLYSCPHLPWVKQAFHQAGMPESGSQQNNWQVVIKGYNFWNLMIQSDWKERRKEFRYIFKKMDVDDSMIRIFRGENYVKKSVTVSLSICKTWPL